MTVCVVQLARFIIRTILAVALTFACLNSGIAQAQELTAHEPPAAENDSAADASKQAANPISQRLADAGSAEYQLDRDAREQWKPSPEQSSVSGP
jgi:hypothetical protein